MHMHMNIAKLFYYICIYHTYKVNIKFHTAVKLYIKIKRFK